MPATVFHMASVALCNETCSGSYEICTRFCRVFTQDSFGLRVLLLPSRVCVCQSWAYLRDNSSPVPARITEFVPGVQNTLVRVPIVWGRLPFKVKFNFKFQISSMSGYSTIVNTTSVGNSHRSASPRPTTLEADRELFVNFSLILCLWFEIQGLRTYNFFDWISNTEYNCQSKYRDRFLTHPNSSRGDFVLFFKAW